MYSQSSEKEKNSHSEPEVDVRASSPDYHSFLQFRISDLQDIINRADTKASIILAAVGVFLGTAIEVKKNLSASQLNTGDIYLIIQKYAYSVVILFSLLCVLFGTLTIRSRKGQGLKNDDKKGEDSSKPIVDITVEYHKHLAALEKIRKRKYRWFSFSLFCFAITSIATISLVFVFFCHSQP